MRASAQAETDLVDRVAGPLLREYDAAFAGLRATLRAIPDTAWATGPTKADWPVRQACHLLSAVQGYSWGGGPRPRVGSRFGQPVETFQRQCDPAGCPSREAVIAWADELQAHCHTWVRQQAARALNGSPKQHSPLDRVVYVLRHTAVHLAYLRQELRRRGIPRPRY